MNNSACLPYEYASLHEYLLPSFILRVYARAKGNACAFKYVNERITSWSLEHVF